MQLLLEIPNTSPILTIQDTIIEKLEKEKLLTDDIETELNIKTTIKTITEFLQEHNITLNFKDEDAFKEVKTPTMINESKTSIKTASSDPPAVQQVLNTTPVYTSPLGLTKAITKAQISLITNGFSSNILLAFVANEWQIVWGAEVQDIANTLNISIKPVNIGKKTKEQINTLYFENMLSTGNLTKAQCALLAARYISLNNISLDTLLENYSDQLDRVNVTHSIYLLTHSVKVFNHMLDQGKVTLNGKQTSLLSKVRTFVQTEVEKRIASRKALEEAAQQFVIEQASSGIAQEDLSTVMQAIATSLKN